MIKNYLITGDCHSDFTRLKNIDTTKYNPEETAVIILGDAGFNFYLDERDSHNKNKVEKMGFTIYCVRGNHEERPENINTMVLWYDEEVSNYVYLEPAHKHIRYLLDGKEYNFNGHNALICPGAYSIDKYWRLSHFDKNATWTGWFKDEQLTEKEMITINNLCYGKSYDFIFAHTCPYEWQPTDLFLKSVDQSTVDNRTEHWLSGIVKNVDYNIFLCGHFHDDRLLRPHAEMFYRDIEELKIIWERWNNKDGPEWWLKKDPNYYFNDNKYAIGANFVDKEE